MDKELERLAKQVPMHPLVAVFQPVMLADQVALENHAVGYYNVIKFSNLPPPQIQVLLDVFTDWLCQRFEYCGKKEIEEMLIGTLPDLRDTQCGKELNLITL